MIAALHAADVAVESRADVVQLVDHRLQPLAVGEVAEAGHKEVEEVQDLPPPVVQRRQVVLVPADLPLSRPTLEPQRHDLRVGPDRPIIPRAGAGDQQPVRLHVPEIVQPRRNLPDQPLQRFGVVEHRITPQTSPAPPYNWS